MFKKLLLTALMIAGITFSSQSATLTTYAAAQAATNGVNLISNGVVVYQITFANTNNTTFNNVYLFDSAVSNVNFLAAAFTNTVLLTSNQVINFTNIVGGVESHTNAVLVASNSVTAAALNYKPIVYSTILSAGTNSQIYRPVYPLFFPSGVTVTNSYGLALTLEYAPIR